MALNLIVATDSVGLIGNKGELPWDLPEDLKYFKQTTEGHLVVMGRKTFQSIGKPLSNRINVIMTRNGKHDDLFFGRDTVVMSKLSQVRDLAKNQDVFVIGGAQIYKMFYQYAKHLYITRIDGEFEGDTYFEWDEDDWTLLEREKGIKDDKNPYDYYFEKYKRKL
jgi:dihydrofolate reductase